MKDGDLLQIGLEPCGVRTCQDEVSTSNACTAVTKKTKHKTENPVNNTELALVLVLQHLSTNAWLERSDYLKQNGIKEATLDGKHPQLSNSQMSDFSQSEPVDHPDRCVCFTFQCHLGHTNRNRSKLSAVPYPPLLSSPPLPTRTLHCSRPGLPLSWTTL